jgi:hypothetical protein
MYIQYIQGLFQSRLGTADTPLLLAAYTNIPFLSTKGLTVFGTQKWDISDSQSVI